MPLHRYHRRDRRVIGGFISWQYGAMGYGKSINKEPFSLKQFLEGWIPTVSSSACSKWAWILNGYPR